jgi:mitogen-activated protein kinase 1/3
VLGTPREDDMAFIGNQAARRYIMKLPRREKMSWKKIYPKANPVALDLLDKMLCFNPQKRWTVQRCLDHPYFRELHNAEDEPLSTSTFDWSSDDFELTKENLQNYVYDESLKFHPE